MPSLQANTVERLTGAFSMTSCMAMEVLTVTKNLLWLKSTNYTHTCIVRDSLSMIQKVKAGSVRRQWTESLHVLTITFVFIPTHLGVDGNERAD
uniref:Uncharacterized protein n=1 Tax=Arion vulgaris TaxID=1028688 RepID=A0A0B7A5H8_9EUPU